MKFVISTQNLENYGAHSEDGKFSSGNAYWKFKGGTDYVVEGLERIQDATAYVAALCIENSIGYKEFPVEMQSYAEWEAKQAELSKDYRDFILETAKFVNPKIRG